MIILKKHINIRLKPLMGTMFFLSLLILGGCTSALPDELQNLVLVRKENCWPCTGYKILWEALASIMEAAFPVTCELALNTLGIALLFWIAFTVGKFVVALKEPNIKEFFTTITLVLFKALVVAVILSMKENVMYVLDLVVTPVISGFVELSRSIMFSDATIAKNFSSFTNYNTIEKSSAIFTSNVGNQLQDIVYRIYLGFGSGMGLGARMLISFDMVSWGLGFVIMIIFAYLMLIIPLIFMEGFIMLGISLIIFPFLLVAYVFPATKSMMKVAWEALFVGVAQIMITCIYLAVFVNVIKSYTNDFSIGKQLTDVMLLTNLKSMSTSALAFFALIWCMFKMSEEIPKMTSFLTGQHNRSIVLKDVKKFTKLLVNTGKFVAGAALAGAGAHNMGNALMSDSTRNMSKGLSGEADDSNRTYNDGGTASLSHTTAMKNK